MRIATYNVNGIRSRLGNLVAWLEREQPDVACLQELKAPDDSFPMEAIAQAGYGAIWQGQKSWNGVAILARGGVPTERRRGLLQHRERGARVADEHLLGRAAEECTDGGGGRCREGGAQAEQRAHKSIRNRR